MYLLTVENLTTSESDGHKADWLSGEASIPQKDEELTSTKENTPYATYTGISLEDKN